MSRPVLFATLVDHPVHRGRPLEPGMLVAIELPSNCIVADPNWPHGPRWSRALISCVMTEEDGARAVAIEMQEHPDAPTGLPLAGTVLDVIDSRSERERSEQREDWFASAVVSLERERDEARALLAAYIEQSDCERAKRERDEYAAIADRAEDERGRLIAEVRGEVERLRRSAASGTDRPTGSGRFTEAQVLRRMSDQLSAIADRGGKEIP